MMSNTKESMYTAQELIWATQLAYCNFEENSILDNLDKEKNYPTAEQLISAKGTSIYYDSQEGKELSGDQETMWSETVNFLNAVANGEKCQGWKIIDVYDREQEEGIYAIMIDTGNGDAIIAFRGSESVNMEQIFKDWGQADFQLLNNVMTKQEKAACRYMDYIGKEERFNQYQNIAVTGHSLGGDLALVSTIYTATEECECDMASRIKQSVSMDGPGHPQEFLDAYSNVQYMSRMSCVC